MYKLSFQLSLHVASKDITALTDSDVEKFFSEHICLCEADVEETNPEDGVECEQSECDDRKMQAWDLLMQNETCICEDDEDENPDDQSLTEQALSQAIEGNFLNWIWKIIQSEQSWAVLIVAVKNELMD